MSEIILKSMSTCRITHSGTEGYRINESARVVNNLDNIIIITYYLRNMMIIWSQGDCPDGVSLFFTPSSTPKVGMFRSYLAADLEDSQSAGFSAETVQAQTKVMKPFFSSRFNKLLHQVQNFYVIFAVIFGSKYCISESLASVMNEIDKNEWLFVTPLQSSSEFAPGFCFTIDS